MRLSFLKYFLFTLGVVDVLTTEDMELTTHDMEITNEAAEITSEDAEIPTEDTKKTTEDIKRYKVVSGREVALQFYPQIRVTKPSPNELNIDLESRQQICRDIFRSNYVRQRLYCFLYYKKYSMFGDTFFLNPVKYAKVTSSMTEDNEELSEWVFVCPYQKRPAGVKIRGMYISEEYKISGDVNSDSYVGGRFIFRFYADRYRLDGLAEPTAKILPLTSVNIERIYINRKINRELAPDPRLDPLGSLKYMEQIRICTAVFGSEYFEDEIDYPDPDMNWIHGSLRRETISFRNSEENPEISNEEWMLNCSQLEERNTNFGYLLSQAYATNEIFIYEYIPQFRGGKYFLKNVATNVRLSVN